MGNDRRGGPSHEDTEVDAEAHHERPSASDTEVDAPAFDGASARRGDEIEMVYAEGKLPLEHTQRVRARQKSRQADIETTHLRVHDPAPPSSSELAENSRKARRRARDARAEKAAIQVVLGVAAALGVGMFFLVDSGVFDSTPPDRPSPSPVGPEEPGTRPPIPGVITTKPEVVLDIPALRSLESEGLTIAAEGLPKVTAISPKRPPPAIAALESCRFAYSVWEFSPNQAFRFMTTCAALGEEVLVGAYRVEGSTVLLSPLSSGSSQLISSFQVKRPSSMTTEVAVRSPSGTVQLKIEQRVTAIRPGMAGDQFRVAFQKKNSLEVQAPDRGTPAPPPKAPPPKGGKPGKDPVLDLLQGQ